MTPALDRFVAMDVEIASRTPLAVCAIAAVRYETGRETACIESRVRYTGHVRYSHIHGLTRSDLREAPTWPVAWRRLVGLCADIPVIVGYRVAFDRAALMTMCARHGLRMLRARFVCAAELYESYAGRSVDLAAALRDLQLEFPGRPHDPLADARAAAALITHLPAVTAEEGSIQVSKNQERAAPTTRR